jgi:spoIIIJ-associated protein
MKNAREFRGETLDTALSEACAALKTRIGELRYDMDTTEDGSEVIVRAEVDPVAVLGLFLSETFSAGQLDVTARLKETEEALEGELSGADCGILIAADGKGLDSLQYLCNRVLNRRLERHQPVRLDTNGFKEQRSYELQNKAESAADEALRTRSPVVMGLMTPAARREIHLALRDDAGVETESDGDGFLKRVVVRPRRRR